MLDARRADFSLLEPCAVREELARIAASRLDLSAELLESLLARAPARRPAPAANPADGNPAPARPPQLSRRDQTERSILAYCVALPQLGQPALDQLEPEADLSSDVTQRAVAHLRAPTESLDDLYDAEVVALIRELAVRAGAMESAKKRDFEIDRLQLARARLGREIAAARESGAEIEELAARRGELEAQLHRLMEQVSGQRTRRRAISRWTASPTASRLRSETASRSSARLSRCGWSKSMTSIDGTPRCVNGVWSSRI